MAGITRQQAAARELLKRQAAIDSIEGFRQYIAPTGHPDFQHRPAPHHQLIIEDLEQLEAGDKLLIMAPPGSAKSTWVSVIFASWRLATHPREMILACSHSESLAETFNRRRRQVCLTAEWQRISESALDPEATSLGQFLTYPQAGGITVGGAGSGITGLRSDVNLLDDPVRGFEQAMSSSQLDKLWEWFLSDFRSRLKPHGIEIVIMTRWAQRDIAGRILELVEQGVEDWRVVRLPMLADTDDDPMGREIGESLWPTWFTDQQIEQNRRDPLRWLCLYQQTPADEKGAWVGQDAISYEDRPPETMRVVAAIDIALSIGKGDWSAIVVAGIDEDKVMHLLHVWRGRVAPNDLAERLIDITDRYKPANVVADNDNMVKVFRNLLSERGKVRNKAPHLSMMPMRGKDKETRASTLRSLFLSDRVRLVRADWNTDFVREVLSFPGGRNDDMIDAAALCARAMMQVGAPPKPSEPEPVKQRIVVIDGVPHLNETLGELFENTLPKRNRI